MAQVMICHFHDCCYIRAHPPSSLFSRLLLALKKRAALLEGLHGQEVTAASH